MFGYIAVVLRYANIYGKSVIYLCMYIYSCIFIFFSYTRPEHTALRVLETDEFLFLFIEPFLN